MDGSSGPQTETQMLQNLVEEGGTGVWWCRGKVRTQRLEPSKVKSPHGISTDSFEPVALEASTLICSPRVRRSSWTTPEWTEPLRRARSQRASPLRSSRRAATGRLLRASFSSRPSRSSSSWAGCCRGPLLSGASESTMDWRSRRWYVSSASFHAAPSCPVLTWPVLQQILFIVFVGLCIELIVLGSGRHFAYIQYVLDVPTVQKTQVLDFAAHIIYTTALLLCRISGLAFYHRVCGMHKRFRVAIKVFFGFLIAAYLPQIFLLIFHCKPVTGLWPYGWEPGTEIYTCLQWGLVYSVNSSVSLVCDLLLFGIPVAMLRILEMPRKRKVQLGCILLPGVA